MLCLLNFNNKHLNILVATSGDTGSAVANGFYKVEGINVIILYPSNKVSRIQEKQITTLDQNIFSDSLDVIRERKTQWHYKQFCS